MYRVRAIVWATAGLVAGCGWAGKPYAADPLVRDTRTVRGKTDRPPAPVADPPAAEPAPPQPPKPPPRTD